MAEPQIKLPLNGMMGYGGASPAGYQIVSSNVPGQVLGQLAINAYSVLSIPANGRAIGYLSENMAAFCRKVLLNDLPPEQPHYLDDLMNKVPNGCQNATVLWRTFYQHRFLTGNGFIKINRKSPTSYTVVSLDNLFPYDVTPFRWAAEDEPLRQYYYVASTKQVLLYNDVLHSMGPSYDGMRGIDPTWLNHDAFDRARTVLQYQTRYLKNGTVLRYAIEVPGGLTPEQKASMVELMSTKYGGPSGDQDIMLLTEGAKISNQTATALDAQLKEQSAASVLDICRINNLPPEVLYHYNESKYNSPLLVDQDVLRNTFRPVIEQDEAEFTRKLLSPGEQKQGYSIKLDTNSLLRGDRATESKIVIGEVTAGIRAPNEARSDLGLPESDDPNANKLKMAGDTTPKAAPNSPPEAPGTQQAAPDEPKDSPAAYNAQNAAGTALTALRPVMDDAARRVDAKAEMAWAAKAQTAHPELVIWANIFAEKQARYVRESLAPIQATLTALGAAPMDVDRIATRYSASVRRRASDGTVKTLNEIISEVGNEQTEHE